VAGLFIFNQHAFGDAFWNFKMYSSAEPLRKFLDFPFKGYWFFLHDSTIRIINKIYVSAMMVFTAGGIVLLVIKTFHSSWRDVSKIFAAFGAALFLFVMSLNHRWA